MFNSKLFFTHNNRLRNDLEKEIKELQASLGKRKFDKIDFKEYSLEELEELETNLLYEVRAKEVEKGDRQWWEAVCIPNKIKGNTLELECKKEKIQTSQSKIDLKKIKEIAVELDKNISVKTKVAPHFRGIGQVNFIKKIIINNGVVVFELFFPKKYGDLNLEKFKEDIECSVLKTKIFSIKKVTDKQVNMSLLLSSLKVVEDDYDSAITLSIFDEFARDAEKEKVDKLNFLLGIDSNGNILKRNLKDYGAIGIYGIGGIGKTNLVKQILHSITLYKSPAEVKFVIIGGDEPEYDSINPSYIYKRISDNAALGIKEDRDKIITILREIANKIKTRKQMANWRDEGAEFIVCLDELRTRDKWYKEVFCPLVESIVSEGRDVGIYTIGTGLNVSKNAKPLHLSEIKNVIYFRLGKFDVDAMSIKDSYKSLNNDLQTGIATDITTIQKAKSFITLPSSFRDVEELVKVKTICLDKL
jgi:hypothetical protein